MVKRNWNKRRYWIQLVSLFFCKSDNQWQISHFSHDKGPAIKKKIWKRSWPNYIHTICFQSVIIFLSGSSKSNFTHYLFSEAWQFKYTCIFGHLWWPFFSPFGYGRVPELFRMTNIWNGNNSEGMTLIRKEWQ